MAPQWDCSAVARRTDAIRSVPDGATVLPLPEGEGRGEGNESSARFACPKPDLRPPGVSVVTMVFGRFRFADLAWVWFLPQRTIDHKTIPMALPKHKTKIVATIGPASDAPEMLERLIHAGLTRLSQPAGG